MEENNNTQIAPWILFLISATLLAGGWFMQPFPLLAFVGFAPLFAIVDQAEDGDAFWTNIEFILLALFVSFFAAHHFNGTFLVSAMVHAIVFALAFLAYSFAHEQLGDRLGKFTILFFWLALEYVALKLPWRSNAIFFAQVMQMFPSATKWTAQTGYLGITLWILVVNLFVYLSIFRSGLNVNWLIATACVLFMPIVYSYFFLSIDGIDYDQMISLYNGADLANATYTKQGELVGRTSAWMSVAIILLAVVKVQTKKK